MVAQTQAQAVNTVIDYIEKNPIRASLEVQFRPEFTYQNTIRDIMLQILMQLCLIGKVDEIQKVRAAATNSENQTESEISKNTLNVLFDIFQKEMDAGENTSEKMAALKKLKKLIHAYADLTNPQFRTGKARRIVNLKKSPSGQPQTKTYAVQDDMDPIIDEADRIKRKTAKSRINRASTVISVVVGIGEGMIAAVFATASLPFLPALLLVGVPALLCNYFLFRGASFSVMKEIYFGKSTDDKKTKALKGVSTLFSAAAGLTYGFLSYGSVAVAFGHLLFGLTAAAALAAPPIGLTILAIVIAGVTAIAITTLYDFTIRGIIDKGVTNIFQKAKEAMVNFMKPDNGKSFSELTPKEKAAHVAKKCLQGFLHLLLYGIATAISVVVVLAVLPIMKHKATSILQGTFRMANQIAHKVSLAITIGLGSLVNGFFYSKQVFNVASLVKKAAHAIWYPKDAARAVQKSFQAATTNTYTKIQAICTGLKRLFLFNTVVMNSVVGQGVGASNSAAAQDVVSDVMTDGNRAVASTLIAASVSMASGCANANGVIEGTKPVEYRSTKVAAALSGQGIFKNNNATNNVARTEEEKGASYSSAP